MAAAKRTRKSKKEGRPSEARRERLFLPVRDPLTLASLVAGGLGAMVLGAGVYLQYFRENPETLGKLADRGPYVVGAGAVLLAVVILLAPDAAQPLLVGDGGVATDAGDDGVRLLWCEIERIDMEPRALVVHGKGQEIRAPLASQPQAAAWIVKEARARIPGRVKLDQAALDALPAVDESAGEARPLPPLQVAGRRCKATDRVISYEPDARLCPTCGEAYHRDHVPETCLTCEHEISGALQVGDDPQEG
jgi:hypothetical protein